MGRKLTQSEFLKRCKSIWGDLYDFSKVNYQSASHLVQVRCKIDDHGFWNAQPRGLIYKPYRGCPECGLKRIGQSNKKDTKKLAQEFKRATELRNQGMTYQAIAYELGYKSRETIRDILKVKKTVRDRKKLSSDQEKDVVLRSNKGESRASIAKLYGVSDTTIRDTLKRKNAYKPIMPKSKTKKEIEKQEKRIENAVNKFMKNTSLETQRKICNEYKLGKSQKKLIQEYKLHCYVLKAFLLKKGVILREYSDTRNFIKEEDYKTICERYKNGESSEKIANSFGVYARGVIKVLKDNDIEIRGTVKDISLEPLYEDISQSYKDGLSIPKLVEKFNVSYTKIRNILDYENVKVRTSNEACKALNDEDEKKIKELYMEGKSLEFLSESFNCSTTAILDFFAKEKFETRAQPEQKWSYGLKDNIEIELCEKYKLGTPTLVLAKEYKINHTTIFRTLRRNNYEVRDQGNLGDSVQHALNQTGLYQFQKDTSFYIFNLNKYPKHLKLGIAFDVVERGQKRWYKDLLFEQVFPSREDAYFVEQAVLNSTIQSWDCPDEIQNDYKWGGRDEVRLMDFRDLENQFKYFYDLWEEEGTWLFAANHFPKNLISEAERELCLKKSEINYSH